MRSVKGVEGYKCAYDARSAGPREPSKNSVNPLRVALGTTIINIYSVVDGNDVLISACWIVRQAESFVGGFKVDGSKE